MAIRFGSGFSRVSLLSLTVLAAPILHAQSPSPDVRGIYVYSSDVSQISKGYANMVTSSLGVLGVDGIVLVIGWGALEPSMGQYQWSTLDQWMNQAVTSGKKVNLTITAGIETPSWLFQPAPAGAGAVPLNFTISPHSGATGVCDSETVAPPWDPAFLARWDSLLAAVAAHLKAAGTYSDVTLLRITGINRTTDELRLPAETPQSTGLACVSDAVSIWRQAGYRPSLLLQAWDQITGSFKKSFPDKTFGVAIIPQNAFPPIAEDGSIIKGTPPDANQPLLSLAGNKLPGRLVVQFNFLMPGEQASSAVIQAAQTLGTMAAFQTNNYFGSTGQGAACSEPVTNPTPCTVATYLALLQTGIYPLGQSSALRAEYIEVFPANANAFPADILQAHYDLDPVRRHSARH
ncbi:MAG TPA: beta-galactosidase [Thermoanaerobaculia bacterium]|nr:beta-galactosidase [Thermoanaerobaculia bacterium]